MCGPPDLGALWISASRIFFTVLFLAGSMAAYMSRDAMMDTLHGLSKRIRQLF